MALAMPVVTAATRKLLTSVTSGPHNRGDIAGDGPAPLEAQAPKAEPDEIEDSLTPEQKDFLWQRILEIWVQHRAPNLANFIAIRQTYMGLHSYTFYQGVCRQYGVAEEALPGPVATTSTTASSSTTTTTPASSTPFASSEFGAPEAEAEGAPISDDLGKDIGKNIGENIMEKPAVGG